MSSSTSNINGDQAAINVDRVIGELRRGCVVRVVDGTRAGLFVAAELSEPDLYTRLASVGTPLVIIAAQRAKTLAVSVDDAQVVAAFAPRGNPNFGDAARLALEVGDGAALDVLQHFQPVAGPAGAAEAVAVAKLARLLPSLYFVDDSASSHVQSGNVLSMNASDVERYPRLRSRSLSRVSEARIPLADFEDCRFVLFRGADGATEHLAIVIGTPLTSEPVPVRLHSSCLTGDLFGSLRCDCGDQLRGAVDTIAELGGGILLYLSQEGRGIGLASKLRAYTLQDGGLDTIDADAHLGYEPDEREYEAATEMLRSLGVSRVRLLTNNPSKVSALNQSSITVEERIPVLADSNPHNIRYLRSKVERAGHLLYLGNAKG